MKSNRTKFITRTVYLVGTPQLEVAHKMLDNAPLDPAQPLELILRERVKARKLDQNALMWVGPLKDIAEQAWHQGRQYADTVWHETFKRLYLPEEFDEELCREGYRKWDYDREGERVLVGSTTQLTIKGFARYLELVYADGASMGVQFHVRES